MEGLNFASWRWSKLKKASSFKRLFDMKSDNLAALITVILCLLALTPSLSEPDAPLGMRYLFYAGICLAVFYILHTVCASDDYVYIDNIGSVYIYKKSKGYILEIVSKQKHDFCYLNNYEIRKVKVGNRRILLYETLKDKKWYYLTKGSREALYLGNRISKTIFETYRRSHNALTELKILDGDGYETFYTDTYYCENIYVSPFYADKIKAIEQFHQTKWLSQATVPMQYLILKDKGENYRIIGLYESKEAGPFFRELAIPIVIFKNQNNHVVLKYQPYGYEKIYDSQSVVKTVCDQIAQFTDQYRVGGIIWKLDPEKKELEKIYEGNFRSIDFEGYITGDNGEKFTFQTKKNPTSL